MFLHVSDLRFSRALLYAHSYPRQYSDLHKLLYNTATSFGAKVRFGAEVVSVNPDAPSVTLQSGEVLTADVLVGADGTEGICRQYMHDEQFSGSEDNGPTSAGPQQTGLCMYACVVFSSGCDDR